MVTIRETQPTANGFVSADKTVSLTTCVAGDTLVIAHAGNSNPFMADPTSDAGSLTQEATVTNAFAGRCRLRVYTCPVGSTGTKVVTFPYTDGAGGGAGDNHGSVLVLAGSLVEDGTSTEDGVDGSSATSIMNTLSPTLATDLLVAFFAAFNTDAAAGYYSAGASGMTLQAQSFDTGFLQLATFTEQLSASGATGTRAVVPVTSDNRYVSAGIAMRVEVVPDGAGLPLTSATGGLRSSSAVGGRLLISSTGGRLQ